MLTDLRSTVQSTFASTSHEELIPAAIIDESQESPAGAIEALSEATFSLPTWNSLESEPGPDEAGAREVVFAEVLQEPLIGKALLVQLEPNWTASQLDEWITKAFFGLLAETNPTEDDLTKAIDQLRAKLRDLGYTPATVKQYQKEWKGVAKQKLGEIAAAKKEEKADLLAAGKLPSRFLVRSMKIARDNESLQTEGIYDIDKSMFLSNFLITFDHEIEIRDEFEPRKVFDGELTIFGNSAPFRIDAADFADNKQLKAAIQVAGGVEAIVYGTPDRLREAICTLNMAPGEQHVKKTVVTPDFGWNQAGDAYLVPSGRITAGGFFANKEQGDLKVELTEELAKNLDLLAPPRQEELSRIKRHVVEDLLQLGDRSVTYSLLGATGAAVLGRFSDHNPFCLWLTGLTGSGKSFLAKLFMNFFGNFPVSSGHFASWSSTSNYLQRVGYFFKDAMYLVDDYKPELAFHNQVIRLTQNYADRTGRGRLKSDATTNLTRPIRGLLVSTGEDVPEHTASALARSIVIPVRQEEKDLNRGSRCLAECSKYRMVMADFIQHLLQRQRTKAFANLARNLQNRYYRDIAGQQNDSRIASNFGLLAAGFVEMAMYFKDVWPAWKAELKQFLNHDLKDIRDDMVGATQEQQASEVFWTMLGALIEFGHVELEVRSSQESSGKPVVGKKVYPGPDGVVAGRMDLIFISTDMAMAEVNKSLRSQGRPELKVTATTLIGELRAKGLVFDEQGQPVSGDQAGTKQLRLNGKPKRGFVTSRSLLVGEKPRSLCNAPFNGASLQVGIGG